MDDTAAWLPELVGAICASVLAITFHEAAHGYAALALGDDTARRAGRLSLNPLRHVDRVGTVLLPGFLLLSQLLTIGHVEVMFGWARPVPVNPAGLRDPRWGMMLVALAGPAMNFSLAWLAGLAAHPLEWGALPTAVGEAGVRVIALVILANLVLGLFNLLPVPPLDGGRVVTALLPRTLAVRFARVERLGIFVILGAVFILPRVAGYDPVGWALHRVVAAAFHLVLVLSGNA